MFSLRNRKKDKDDDKKPKKPDDKSLRDKDDDRKSKKQDEKSIREKDDDRKSKKQDDKIIREKKKYAFNIRPSKEENIESKPHTSFRMIKECLSKSDQTSKSHSYSHIQKPVSKMSTSSLNITPSKESKKGPSSFEHPSSFGSESMFSTSSDRSSSKEIKSQDFSSSSLFSESSDQDERHAMHGWFTSPIKTDSDLNLDEFEGLTLETKSPEKKAAVIPELKTLSDDDMPSDVADAPSHTISKIASFQELDSDLLKHAAFQTLDGIDLSLLTKCLLPEEFVTQKDDNVWTWDTLFADVSSHLNPIIDKKEDSFSDTTEKDGKDLFK